MSASASSQELRQRVSVLPVSRGITPTIHVSPESYAAAPVTNEMLWSKMLQIEGLIRANYTAIVSNTVKTDLAFDILNNVVETMTEVKTNLANAPTLTTFQKSIDEVYGLPMGTGEAVDKLDEDLNNDPQLWSRMVSVK